MLSQEHESYQRGDSDDEIAELRFQALLTKKENEAEVSPTRQQHIYAPPPMALNQPLSNYQEHFPVMQNYYRGRGRGRGSTYKPYLQTFSQQIASNSVNSSNIVVLTSTNPEEVKPMYEPLYGPRLNGPNIAWPQVPLGIPNKYGCQSTAPKLILPQDNYANQQRPVQEADQNKAKLSARMKRLQDSASDSEDSESDSSGSSSDSSSSDSSSSSSDSSSSDSDSDSDNGGPASQENKVKGANGPNSGVKAANEVAPINELKEDTCIMKTDSTVLEPRGIKSPVNRIDSPVGKTLSPKPRSYNNKEISSYKKYSRSPSYSRKFHSASRSTSPKRYSRSRSRTPLHYRSRSPYSYRRSASPVRITHSPLRGTSRSPTPPKQIFRRSSRSRDRARSPLPSKRFRSRSPYLRRSRSFTPRRDRHSPLPLRRSSRSPLAHRYRSRSPVGRRYSPKYSIKRGSHTPPPRGRLYSRSPPPYSRRLRSITPKRFRDSRSPMRYKSKSPYLSSPMKRKLSQSPIRKYRSKSPFSFTRTSPRPRSPYEKEKSPYFNSPRRTYPIAHPPGSSPRHSTQQQYPEGHERYNENRPDMFGDYKRHEVDGHFRPPQNLGRQSPNIFQQRDFGQGSLPLPGGIYASPPHHLGERPIRPMTQDVSVPPPIMQRFPHPDITRPPFNHERFPHPNSQGVEFNSNIKQPLLQRPPNSSLLQPELPQNLRHPMPPEILRLPPPIRPAFPGSRFPVAPQLHQDFVNRPLLSSPPPPFQPGERMIRPSIHRPFNEEGRDNFDDGHINEHFEGRGRSRGRLFRGAGRIGGPPRGGATRNYEDPFLRPPLDGPNHDLSQLTDPVLLKENQYQLGPPIENRQFHEENLPLPDRHLYDGQPIVQGRHPMEEHRHSLHLNPEKFKFHDERSQSMHLHPERAFRKEHPRPLDQERLFYNDPSLHKKSENFLQHSPVHVFESRPPPLHRRSLSPVRGPKTPPPYLPHRERSLERNKRVINRNAARSPSPSRRNYRSKQIDMSPKRIHSFQHESKYDSRREYENLDSRNSGSTRRQEHEDISQKRNDKYLDRKVERACSNDNYSNRDDSTKRRPERSRSPYKGNRPRETEYSDEDPAAVKRRKIGKDEGYDNMKSINETDVNRRRRVEEWKGRELSERSSNSRLREDMRHRPSNERIESQQISDRRSEGPPKDKKFNSKPHLGSSSKEPDNVKEHRSKDIGDRQHRVDRERQMGDRHDKVDRNKQVSDRHFKDDLDKQLLSDRQCKDDYKRQMSENIAKHDRDKQINDRIPKDDRSKQLSNQYHKDGRNKLLSDRREKDDSVRQTKDDHDKRVSNRQSKNDRLVDDRKIKDDPDKRVSDRQNKDDLQRQVSDRQNKDDCDKRVNDRQSKDDGDKRINDRQSKDDRDKRIDDRHSKDDRDKRIDDRHSKVDYDRHGSDRQVKGVSTKSKNSRQDEVEVKLTKDRQSKESRVMNHDKKNVKEESEHSPNEVRKRSSSLEKRPLKSHRKKVSTPTIPDEKLKDRSTTPEKKSLNKDTEIEKDERKQAGHKQRDRSREASVERKKEHRKKGASREDNREKSHPKEKEPIEEEIEEGELVKKSSKKETRENKKKKKKKEKVAKKKKEKKKKKESKKKAKKSSHGSDEAEETPSLKKRKVSRSLITEKSSRKRPNNDQSKIRVDFSDRQRDHDEQLKRKVRPPPLLTDGGDNARGLERRHMEERRHRDRDVYQPRGRSREDRRPTSKKDPNALLVTVRSDDNRRVMSGSSSKNISDSGDGMRLPVHMRLGPSTSSPVPPKVGRPQSRGSQNIVNRHSRVGRSTGPGGTKSRNR